jgi:lipopolysaccharide export system protein LptA
VRLVLRLLLSFSLVIGVWLVWPRELDGLSLGRDGRLAVPDYALSGLRYVSVKNGAVELEATAHEASYDLSRQILVAKKVRSFIHHEQGGKTLVEGDRGQLFQVQRQLKLEGNVYSITPDGFEIASKEADYFIDRRFLVASGGVHGDYKKDRLQVWGDRAESNVDAAVVDLLGNARSEQLQAKEGFTRLKGDRARFDRNSQRVDFFENVEVEQPRTRGTSRRASLTLDRNNREMSYLAMNEDVKIKDDSGRSTRSQVAEFFGPTNTIILSGFPAVYHGDDAVTGDRITLYRSTGVVEVTATNAAGQPQGEENKAPQVKEKRTLTEEDKELIP